MYVITGSMTAGNWNQLKEMDNYGWAICNHTKNHPNLTGLSVAAQLAELDGAKNDLIFNNMGRNALHVAYPGGAADANTYIAMANGGYLTGRVITVGSGDGFPALPCDYPYRFPMSKQFGNTVTLAQAKTWVDGIITNSRIGVGLFHSLIPGVPTLSTEWNISDFYALIDYIAAKGVAVLTIPQAWNLMSGPIVVEKTQ